MSSGSDEDAARDRKGCDRFVSCSFGTEVRFDEFDVGELPGEREVEGLEHRTQSRAVRAPFDTCDRHVAHEPPLRREMRLERSVDRFLDVFQTGDPRPHDPVRERAEAIDTGEHVLERCILERSFDDSDGTLVDLSEELERYMQVVGRREPTFEERFDRLADPFKLLSDMWRDAYSDEHAPLGHPNTPHRLLTDPHDTHVFSYYKTLSLRKPFQEPVVPAVMLEIVRAIYAPSDSGVLIVQRPPDKRFGSLWSLPGGTVEDGESLDGALRREVREELGLEVTSVDLYRRTKVVDPREGRIGDTYFFIEARGSIRTNGESVAHAFITPRSLRGYDFAFGHGWVLEDYFERFV